MRPNPNVITVLQAGRALAALAVVLHHGGQFARDFVAPVGPAASGLLDRGYLGVDFFFVLSGFIIYHTNAGKTQAEGWSRRYAETRMVRIYIPYLPIGVAIALFYAFLPGLSGSTREWGWFTSLSLLPSSQQPALIVAWTLQHELVFYAVFWIAFASRRPALVLATWTLAMAACTLAWSHADIPLAAYSLAGDINVEFLFGMAVVRLLPGRVPNVAFLAGGALLFALYVGLGGEEVHRIVFAAALACLLIPIVRWEQAERLAAPAFLVLLGNASYAIYLVHNPAMSLLARGPLPSPGLTVAWLAAAGTAVGLAYHFLVEKPGIAFAKARLRGLLSGTPPAAA